VFGAWMAEDEEVTKLNEQQRIRAKSMASELRQAADRAWDRDMKALAAKLHTMARELEVHA
jgi:hypothetical protein